MARLSEMHKLIGEYLEAHGDKEVTSIGTCHGGAGREFVLRLCDIRTSWRDCRSGEDEIAIPGSF